MNEGVLITGAGDAIVESSMTVTIEVAVVDRRDPHRYLVGKDVDGDGRPDAPILLTDSANFIPARGESRDTATARVLRDLAERTAQILEQGWGGAHGR